MVTKSYKVISCWLQYCNPLLRWLLPCPAAPGLMLALLCYCLPCYCCWVRALLCGPSQISWMCFNFRKHATSRGRARAANSASSASSSARARRRQLRQLRARAPPAPPAVAADAAAVLILRAPLVGGGRCAWV